MPPVSHGDAGTAAPAASRKDCGGTGFNVNAITLLVFDVSPSSPLPPHQHCLDVS